MVKDETLRNENEIFKTNLEENFIPQIKDRIDNGENRIEYTEEEIKQILEVDYTTENFYQRFKTMLLNTEIGVSIKRIPGNNKFIFFRKLEGVKKESDLVKVDLKEKLISQIRDRIDNGENRIEYTEEEIKQILEVDYTTENLYVKLKNKLSIVGIGVSIKRIPGNNKFIFFERLYGVKRESDIFKAKFEHQFKPKLIEYLNSHISIGIPEDWIKEKLYMVGYSTDSVYNKLRGMLAVSGITVSIQRKNSGNGFIFYNKKLAEEHDARVDKEVKEYEEKRKIILEAERQEELNRPYPEDLFSDIASKFPPPPKSLESKFRESKDGSEEVDEKKFFDKDSNRSIKFELDDGSMMKFYKKENDDSEDDFNSLSKCPVCGSDVVMFSSKCHDCGTVLKWKEESI